MRFVAVALATLLVSTPLWGQAGSPAGAVPSHLLTQRRALLLDRIGDGVVILKSARELNLEGEDFPQASDFRQDDDFFYLTGLETPNSWLVLVAHTNAPDQIVLFIPPRSPEDELWTGPRMTTAQAAALTGINDVRTSDVAVSAMQQLTRNATPVYVRIPEFAEQLCNASARKLDCAWLFLQPLTPINAELRDAHAQIAALRLIKDEEELRRLRQAIDITENALLRAFKESRPGQWEFQIEAAIEYVFRSSGAERVGFPTIVGSGPNSTTLHYDKGRRQTKAGDLVVMDIGAEYGYYTADVTRTMPISGKFTSRQRALYDLVLATQQATIDSVRPGITLPRLDDIAREYMKHNSGNLCGAKTCDEYFMHGIGHWLGMDVHDPGDMTTPLASGMVLTVEPGVYLANEDLGIRIEDDVLVTPAGHELLSGKAPRRAADIEKLMSGVN